MSVTNVHDLVRVDPNIGSRWPHAETWIAPSLQRAPWVVVRREQTADAITIGIRGVRRAERFAASLGAGDAREVVAPSALWGRPVRNARLGHVYESLLAFCAPSELSLAPLGSFAFELASDVSTTHSGSDLDVLLDATGVPRDVLAGVYAEVEHLVLAHGVRIDVELAYAYGAAALHEILAQRDRVLFKTPSGPTLLPCPV